MQSVINFFGGHLDNVKGHVAVRHKITGELPINEVNSYHNQACKVLEDESGLKVLAQSEDGAIEAVRHETLPILGIMWHPEREEIYREAEINMVRNLFQQGFEKEIRA